MDFKELETRANTSPNLVRLHQTSESKKYEEAREILRRLFPQERVVRNFVEYYNWDKKMFGYVGDFLSELLNCDGQDNLRLRRISEIRTCHCGCNMVQLSEKYYILAPESEEDKVKRCGWNEAGEIETHLLSRSLGINRDFWAQVNPDFERVVPGAMDEWLKMQFEANANK